MLFWLLSFKYLISENVVGCGCFYNSYLYLVDLFFCVYYMFFLVNVLVVEFMLGMNYLFV